MATASYWQRGEALDYKNTTAKVIEANTVIELNGRIGIAGAEINPSETGSIHVSGVYEMPKTGTAAIEMGAAVYYDGTGITDSADNGETGDAKVSYTAAGYAAAAAEAADTVILVKLQG